MQDDSSRPTPGERPSLASAALCFLPLLSYSIYSIVKFGVGIGFGLWLDLEFMGLW